jgi:hypothetical protein
MDLKVQQHLAVSSHEYTAELSAGFILATDFGLFYMLASVGAISHQAYYSSSTPVLTQSTRPKKR